MISAAARSFRSKTLVFVGSSIFMHAIQPFLNSIRVQVSLSDTISIIFSSIRFTCRSDPDNIAIFEAESLFPLHSALTNLPLSLNFQGFPSHLDYTQFWS